MLFTSIATSPRGATHVACTAKRPLENVWDYPRPPALEKTTHDIKIMVNQTVIAQTREAWRVLETSHPPTYYLPPEAITPGVLRVAPGGSTTCEWKVGLGDTFWRRSNTHTLNRGKPHTTTWSWGMIVIPCSRARRGPTTSQPPPLHPLRAAWRFTLTHRWSALSMGSVCSPSLDRFTGGG